MAEMESEWIGGVQCRSLSVFIPCLIGSGKGPRSALIGRVKEGEQNRDIVLATRIVRRL